MGSIPQGEHETYLSPSIQYARPHHRRMARLLVGGVRPTEIARIMGFSNGQISRILGSPHIRIEVARLEARANDVAVDIRKDIDEMAKRAAEILDEDLEMEVTDRFERKLRQDAARDILDRAGVRRNTERSEHRHLHLHKEVKNLSDDDLRDDVFDLCKVK